MNQLTRFLVLLLLASAAPLRVEGETPRLPEAIAHYQAIAAAAAPDSLQRAVALREVAQLYERAKRPQEAIAAWEQAIALGDSMLDAAYTTIGRQSEAGTVAEAYRGAAYCMLRLGRIAHIERDEPTVPVGHEHQLAVIGWLSPMSVVGVGVATLAGRERPTNVLDAPIGDLHRVGRVCDIDQAEVAVTILITVAAGRGRVRVAAGRHGRVGEGSTQVGAVRGKGLMLGVEFVKDKATKEPAPEVATKVRARCLRHGLLMEIGGHYSNVARFLPPLVVTTDLARKGIEIFAEAVREVGREPGSAPDLAVTGQRPELKRACDSTKTPDVEFDHALRLQMMTITGE
jgi:tetratricopeptide (TPR) repeat protein